VSEPAIAYGRKSFDDPDERTSSVDDQQLFAEAYARSHGFDLLGFYGDDGITGATMERPGLQAALKVLASGKIRILIIEDVDRLGRDAEHIHHMVKLFRLYQVTVHTVSTGRIDDLVFAFKAIIGEQQRMRIAYTTRRGLKGKARRGGVTGGKVLGYRREITGQDAGGRDVDRLVIDDPQSELVQRIFNLYSEGQSLKQICAILNRDGIPSPRARERGKYNAGVWNPTTLSGDRSLGEGILNNEIYIGRRIFNRRIWVEVPNDNRGFSRRPRLNPETEWIINDQPELRIIDQALWDAVKVRQKEARAARDAKYKLTGNPLAGAKRPAHLLSGLVTCGACEAPFLATGAGRWRCKSHRTGTCTNGSITTRELEERALAGIRDRLLTPEIIGRFAAKLQTELEAMHLANHADRNHVEGELVATRRRIAKLVSRIEEDDDAPRALTVRLKELETIEAGLEIALAEAPEPTVVRLPANYEAVYSRAVAELETHLSSSDGAVARQAIRPIIEKIVVQPGSARGGKRRPIQLHGDLYRMLQFAESACAPNAQKPRPVRDGAFVIPLVAGTGFEPVTFRL
jgi:site-specific DNA recombinase